eukprot:Selendium_serpulae@DN5482_c0_g1_i2.p1
MQKRCSDIICCLYWIGLLSCACALNFYFFSFDPRSLARLSQLSHPHSTHTSLPDTFLGLTRYQQVHTRVFVLNVVWEKAPTTNRTADAVYGFVESWRHIFNIPEKPEERHCPWSLLGKLVATEKQKVVVNDILIVTDPRVNLSTFPVHCEVLRPYADDVDVIIARLKIQQRLIDRVSRCFVLQTFVPTDPNVWEDVNDIHSIAALTEPAVVSLIGQYDLVFKVGSDSLLLPSINNDDNIPNVRERELLVGQDDYSSPTTRELIGNYASLFGYGKPNVSNINPVWCGYVEDVVHIARISLRIARFILEYDPIFHLKLYQPLEWRKEFIPRYSAEIGISETIQKNNLKRTESLRYFNATESFVHSLESKDLPILASIPDLTSFQRLSDDDLVATLLTEGARWGEVETYLINSAIAGQWRRRMEWEDVRVSVKNPPLSKEIVKEMLSWTVCPTNFPYPYARGARCCSKNTDCKDVKITFKSECCGGESFQCLAGLGCNKGGKKR